MDLARATAPLPTDRRSSPRARVACTAHLRTSFANIVGELWDLSISGARFVSDDIPKIGATALLEWGDHDAMCRVVWSKDGMCGLRFDKPIGRSVVDKCAAPVRQQEAVAALGNIPLGRRRSLLSSSEPEPVIESMPEAATPRVAVPEMEVPVVAGPEVATLQVAAPEETASEQSEDGRIWSVRLTMPGGRRPALHPNTMTASELMFFLGAPLAHVVDYEREKPEAGF